MVPYYRVQGPRRETGEMSGKARRGWSVWSVRWRALLIAYCINETERCRTGLVYLVGLVILVCLVAGEKGETSANGGKARNGERVYLVCLVYFVVRSERPPGKPDKPKKPDRPDGLEKPLWSFGSSFF